MKKMIGISIGAMQSAYGDKAALALAKKLGADAVDFSLYGKTNDFRVAGSVYSQGDEAIRDYYTQIGEYAKQLGLIISQTHGKLTGFIGEEKADNELVENIRLDCLATAALGAPVCVVHNATSINLGPSPDPVLMQKLSYDLFSRTVPFAAEYGIKIATETFGDAVKFNSVDFFGDIDEFMTAYNAIKQDARFADHFTTCADTGHSNKAMRFGNPTAGDVIRRIGSDIAVLHLNDNDTLTDQHKMPFSGTIDWEDTFNALDEIGYNGVYNMELHLPFYGAEMMLETAEFAIKVLRNYLDKRYGLN